MWSRQAFMHEAQPSPVSLSKARPLLPWDTYYVVSGTKNFLNIGVVYSLLVPILTASSHRVDSLSENRPLSRPGPTSSLVWIIACLANRSSPPESSHVLCMRTEWVWLLKRNHLHDSVAVICPCRVWGDEDDNVRNKDGDPVSDCLKRPSPAADWDKTKQ